MTPLPKNCRITGQPFVITDEDQALLSKMGMPLPTLCPEERRRRRFAHRNERHLYHRSCGLSGKALISNYSKEGGIPVYDQAEWWGDKWDASSYGRDFDFTRPFFEQFAELSRVVPQLALSVWNSENSSYCNYVGNVKDSYLIFGSVYSDKCYFGSPYYSTDCLDTLVVRDCEHCYECIDCRKLYECFYCQDCSTSSGLIYSYDCHSCQDCIGCAGLRRKQYCIFNKQVSKEEYEKFKSDLKLWDSATREHLNEELNKLKKEIPHRYMHSNQVENVSGDYVYQSRNAQNSFFTDRCEDVAHCMQVVDLKDCSDNNFTEENELCYEYLGAYQNLRLACSKFCNKVSESYYLDSCFNSKNLFGCIGMRGKSYCILNKQYSKEEYEALLPRVIEHLKKTGEWGEFFPIEISNFAYNETVADEYFPLSEQEVRAKGYAWKADDEENSYQGPKAAFPENIAEVPDSIVDQILTCEVSGKLYKLIPPELEFYRRMKLPVPRRSPNQRHRDRLAKRNPQQLWQRACTDCGNSISTVYSPDRSEKVYCDACYLKLVY